MFWQLRLFLRFSRLDVPLLLVDCGVWVLNFWPSFWRSRGSSCVCVSFASGVSVSSLRGCLLRMSLSSKFLYISFPYQLQFMLGSQGVVGFLFDTGGGGVFPTCLLIKILWKYRSRVGVGVEGLIPSQDSKNFLYFSTFINMFRLKYSPGHDILQIDRTFKYYQLGVATKFKISKIKLKFNISFVWFK